MFDPSSEVDLDDFDENSYEARPAMLDKQAVQVIQWGQVNPALWQLIESMHREAERVCRYSDLMMGQGKSAETATEAYIQQQQGNSTTDHKKLTLQDSLVDVCEYMLGLMMEYYKGAKAFRISGDKDAYEWIDFRQLKKVPVMKPATRSFIKQYTEKNTDAEMPEWELVTDKSNNPLTKNVDLDIEINIGAGLPKNKTFLWQMVQTLASVVVVDNNGQERNLISYDEFRKFVKDFLGLPLDDTNQSNEVMKQTQPQQAQPQAQMPTSPEGAISQGVNGIPSIAPTQIMDSNPMGGML